jgi:hypothetical protein
MSEGSSSTEFRCPACGAASAVMLPEEGQTPDTLTLRCLTCARLMRLPRGQVTRLELDGPPESGRV